MAAFATQLLKMFTLGDETTKRTTTLMAATLRARSGEAFKATLAAMRTALGMDRLMDIGKDDPEFKKVRPKMGGFVKPELRMI